MNFLLKIVDGPVKGAEIALVEGLRLKVGSGDACDIVLADSSLPALAFELDVSGDAVSLVAGDVVKVLTPFEIVHQGTSAFAIGPAEGEWQALTEAPPPPAPTEPEPEPASAPAAEPAAEASSGEPVAEPAAEGETAPQAAPDAAPAEERRERKVGWIWGVIALVLLIVLAWALWHWWPALSERWPALENTRVNVVEKAERHWAQMTGGKVAAKPAAADLAKAPTLAEVARDHALELKDEAGVPVLKGNVTRRTERMAIRALALAADPKVKLDLTDDESLLAAANELLFVVTEGAVKATAADNRVLSLAGYSPSAAALEKTLRALNADVKGIDRALTAAVQVGGTPPPKPGAPVFQERQQETPAPRARGVRPNPANDYPIAGILSVPYPCVVMRNGMRLVEGAQIGKAVVEKIEPGRLVLRTGATTFEWKP